MPLFIFNNEAILYKQYKFRLRSLRKELTLIQFFKKKQFILRGNNKAVMFVRAPKHFKSGKQKIFFFCGVYTKKFFLKSFFDYR